MKFDRDFDDAFLAKHELKRISVDFDCPNGWQGLLERLVVDLKALGWDGDLHQVKAKFGGLRFYVGKTTAAMQKRIDQAEVESFLTCEMCGNPGKIHNHEGWLSTRCEAHKHERWE